jgi:hypothetical protein
MAAGQLAECAGRGGELGLTLALLLDDRLLDGDPARPLARCRVGRPLGLLQGAGERARFLSGRFGAGLCRLSSLAPAQIS